MNSKAVRRSSAIAPFLLAIVSCNQVQIQSEPSFIFSPTVQYSVSRDEANDMYRSLDVQLNQSVEETTLELIAQEIVEREAAQYTRTSILYYLPGMESGNGAWASTHSSYGSTRANFDISPKMEEATRGVGLDSFTGPPEASLIETLNDLQDMLADRKSRYGDQDPGLVYFQRKITEIESLIARYQKD